MDSISSKSDAQIRADVLHELKWDTTVDEAEVGVQVKDGIVTLTGTVSAYPRRLAAVDAVHRVQGVLDVVDDMRVRIPSPSERSDHDIAQAVRSALQWDVLVPDERITSTVARGEVTLHGTVDTWMQRYNAERAVMHLTGVRSVINRIAIAATSADPGLIKRQIEDALERRSERDAKRLGISVRDGVVVVTGVVKSWGEKNLIERTVSFAPGVRRVEDRTVVDPYL